MSELNLEEDNYEDNESVNKSEISKQRKKEVNPSSYETGSTKKKKTRRSRIIISDPSESINDYYKKEIYDPDTKYKKALVSAVGFNEFINSSRKGISKHFLKRKVKAAFEREPIEKSKGFNFNVPFIPSLSIFATTQTNPSQTSSHPHRSGQPHSYQRQVDKTSTQPQSASDMDRTVIINLNQGRSDTKLGSQGKNLFNVNSATQEGTPNTAQKTSNVTSVNKPEIKSDFEKEVRIDLRNINKGGERENTNFPSAGNSKISSSSHTLTGTANTPGNAGSNMNVKNTAGILPNNPGEKHQPLKNLSMSNSGSGSANTGPSSINANNVCITSNSSGTILNANPSNSHSNVDMIRYQQQIRFKALYEMYRRDPEKLKQEIGQNEFLKFQNMVKNLQMKKEMEQKNMQNSGGHTTTTSSQFSQSPNLNLQLLQNKSGDITNTNTSVNTSNQNENK